MTVPRGIPCFNSIRSDRIQFTDTCCNRPIKKLSTMYTAEGKKWNDRIF